MAALNAPYATSRTGSKAKLKSTPVRRARLGEQLQKKRVEQGFSISSLSRASGVSPNTIRAIEKGLPCHQASVHHIQNFLSTGDSLDVVSVGPTVYEQLSDEDLEIAKRYRDAPTDLRMYISEMLKARNYKKFTGPDPNLIARSRRIEKLKVFQVKAMDALLDHFETDNNG